MSRFDKKIADAEVLVDVILEQGFSINVGLSNLNGNSEVDWSECYNTRCKSQKNDYDRKECKAQCQWSAYNVLISRMGALRSRCRENTNPEGCLRTIQKAVDTTRDKQRKARTDIANIRRAAAEERRKQAQTQRVRGEESPR